MRYQPIGMTARIGGSNMENQINIRGINMKLRIPTNVYKRNWDSFMNTYGDTADLETKLEKTMSEYKGFGLTPEAIEIIRKHEAKKIAKRCEEYLVPNKEAIERIEAGEATLGYTTRSQEITAMRNLVERVEFTALCLTIFMKKYGIN